MPYDEGAGEVRKKATVECVGLRNTHYEKIYVCPYFLGAFKTNARLSLCAVAQEVVIYRCLLCSILILRLCY